MSIDTLTFDEALKIAKIIPVSDFLRDQGLMFIACKKGLKVGLSKHPIEKAFKFDKYSLTLSYKSVDIFHELKERDDGWPYDELKSLYSKIEDSDSRKMSYDHMEKIGLRRAREILVWGS